MKRIIILISAVLVGLSSCTYDDSALVGRVENLEDRVTKLEKLCKEMNANIDAMAAIIEALETHDYITSVTPITKDGETVGYTITFAKGEPITIYHGEDGKDGVDGENGADGKDGKDGYTPVIGVEQDGDGIYYWTLDGEWLLDDAGNKIKAVGVDGKDGQDGQDGQDGEDGANGANGANGSDGEDGENGADGKDGVDGITPQLKIENDYWYISYDNGTTWTQLGKATGEDGANGSDGADGADGKDGDSFFEGVDTSNDDYVVFTLADGTTIKIPTWYAFEQLKKQCEVMNQNISSLQTIVEALQNNDYVTSVQQIVEDGKTIGYTIYFSKSGAVTIYHGEDGKDGADGTDGVNGADGKDGHSPIVGVRQDSDGIYYWTLDGEWLLDDAGNKIKAVGVDGKDGQDGADGENGSDGADGENGADGKDGVDGITPQLKIENEYWYISYDNGTTWTQLGKATGEDGQDGANGSDGADGKDGDAFFESVDTSDKNYVVLTLIDGTTIQIPTWYAFEQLQALCNQMNTNISSLQTIVEALQNNDYVTSVTPVLEGGKTVGYTINFSKSGAVTIYHGENGKDGADGLDGHSPQIGVKQHTDGIYYWTLDGEWLKDANGNKIKAVGIDGANGSNGANGVDGITPQLKIENDYWYISYDNGTTWTQLGKATGEDGANGSDGADGKDGDAFFESVDTSDKNYVILTLIDGTTIQIPTWYAFEQLQALCNQMNTNISSLQTIVEALQNNDYVTSVTPVLEGGKTIGYTINFSKSGAVTIYHGENGKDGANGLDGHSPQIGVKQHTDGIYYWTLDGEWLKDANGNKIKAVGIDGANGSDGKDGVDGITPQLKIENDYWYISYDNGTTWTQLGKATGEDGKDGANGSDGADGADGKDGDAFFESVDTSDKNYVVLTLIDGTTIQIPTWYAFEQLQALCNQMNTNISSLQTIVEALQNNDYVTSVTPVLEGGKTIGYTINFSKSGAVTIYHGENGKDGADGLDGHSPQIGVKQHTDGIYYWTLDGEWLKDANGNKIKAVGIDGANGSNGANGVDGITPQLKIENDYWYISYDNGATWTQLGKATGEDGKDGANGSDGADGKDGDAFFESVDTSDKNYVVLTLIDGTTIKIPTWYAFEQLQALCNQMNTNISSLQTIVEALQNNDYVTSVTPVLEGGKTIGYTINFSKSGAVTIYHGENGKDGADGLDGHSPQIGVKQHTDGIYYWTLDGEWLKDANGNKIKAVGIDGANGANGSNGANGVDGITPQLKIENDYWYISYDNGTTWTQLGKATGEDGQDGANGSDGADGKDGDAFFESVDTSDKNYVVLTLIDGTTIQIPTWYAFEQLQALCNQMNTNISSLQTIVEALQNNDYVTSVTPVVDGGKTIGYTINFSKSGAVTIYHGENGKDGADGLDGHSPQIGVKQHTDGVYYWTLDGEWLKDANGNKIKAVGIDGANGSNGANGVDGITPQLKIENDYWYISYDNGSTWTQLGKATGEDGKDGDSFFQSVTQDEQYVYFTLADGTQITLPKGALLSISFDASDLVVMTPNSTREIGYSVQSVTESVTVEVTSSSDLRAKVVPASADGKSGNIVVTSSGVVDEYSKVIVFVSNGEKVVMKSIGFEQAGITISNGAEQTIGAEGGRVNLNFASNIDWKVAIPAEAQSWVQLAPQRSAMTEYSVALSVAPNTNLDTRSATVQVMTKDGKIAVDYTITQSTFTAVTATNANGWNAGDALAVFAGNTRNQQFKYMGAAGATSGTFEAVTVASGSAAAASAHYAVYPYKSSYRLSNGAISMTLPNSQSYVAGGYSSALDVMVGVSNGVADTNIALQPLCAYVCVKLWGAEQTIKSVTLASKGGEALAGNASVTPKFGAAPECVFTTKPSSTISMTCTELTLGTAEASATEFWFVVPPVALASGYSIKVAGFYGGEQTIDFPATTFASGAIYNIGAEVTVSTNGPGMGVGGWGDGENVDGEI